MLLEQETKEKYGYEIKDLSKGSGKQILVRCDYCGKICSVSMKFRTKANLVIDKDACRKCGTIKRKELCLIKNGVDSTSKLKSVRDKFKETCLERYGVDSPFKVDGFSEKRKETVLEKYGVESTSQIEEVKEKMRQTNLDKYGVEYVSQNKEIQERVRQTNLEKYGVGCFLESDYAREKKNETIKRVYGVDNIFQVEGVKEKIKQANLEKYGVDHPMKVKEIAKAAAIKTEQTKIKNGQIKLYNGKTIAQMSRETGYSDHGFRCLIEKYGYEVAIKMTPRINTLEQIFQQWLSSINVQWIDHYNVDKYFADLYLPDHNLLLELDGIYWHSDKAQADKYYHFNKKNTYENNGFNSLFFREDEIEQKSDIVKSIILNKCGMSTRIFARKCKVEEISREEANSFLKQNHLMGCGVGYSLGLKYNNELVSILRMKRLKNKDYDISRTCTKLNTNVVGGFSKLLFYFIKNTDVDNIYTFIDKRYGSGKYLTSDKLGFTLINNDVSFRWTDFTNTFYRMNFPSNTGYDEGFYKIWDCGQARYHKQIV